MDKHSFPAYFVTVSINKDFLNIAPDSVQKSIIATLSDLEYLSNNVWNLNDQTLTTKDGRLFLKLRQHGANNLEVYAAHVVTSWFVS